MYTYQTLEVTLSDSIAWVRFNRPEKANALNQEAWKEIKTAFQALDQEDTVRVIILGGHGQHFCSGIDLSLLQSILHSKESCNARIREQLRQQILELQDAVSSIENCSKPVIAAITGGCIGAGLDIICACDMRYGSADAFFSIKEIDMGMVADLGTLQRLPRLIHEGILRELAYTGRNVDATEAECIGLINKKWDSRETLHEEVEALALQIAQKSPISIRGTKHILNYSRDHTIADGLHYMATWNAAMLLSEDIEEAFRAKMEKRPPHYRN